MKKQRRRFSAADKAAIVKAHLVNKVSVSDPSGERPSESEKMKA